MIVVKKSIVTAKIIKISDINKQILYHTGDSNSLAESVSPIIIEYRTPSVRTSTIFESSKLIYTPHIKIDLNIVMMKNAMSSIINIARLRFGMPTLDNSIIIIIVAINVYNMQNRRRKAIAIIYLIIDYS